MRPQTDFLSSKRMILSHRSHLLLTVYSLKHLKITGCSPMNLGCGMEGGLQEWRYDRWIRQEGPRQFPIVVIALA